MQKLPFLFLALLFLGCSGEHADDTHHAEEPSQKELTEPGLNVGILIMDGTYNTEMTAPYDIFHHTKFREDIDAMNVFTIAKSTDPITTFEGMQVIPDYSYNGKHPEIDVFVVPSAEGHLDKDLEDEEMIDFVRTTSIKAEWVTSHCDGAFVLAHAGLLDGIHCTTFPSDVNEMRDKYDLPIIHDSVMFVHDGKFITSQGGDKSFEASLYLVELLYGKQNADEIAEGMVIDWELDSIPYLVFNKKEDQN